MKKAIAAHLGMIQPHLNSAAFEKLETRLMGQVSFHLIAPMTEAWFFADPPSLTRAGVPGGRLVETDHERYEEFSTSDPVFVQARGQKHRNHPKKYLAHLSEREGVDEVGYREAEEGAAALAKLAFDRALNHSMPFLTRMMEDLYLMLEEPLPTWLHATRGPCAVASAGKDARLRNL